jgi:hypothetical protein
MKDRVVLLHPPIVSCAKKLAAAGEDGADWDPTF